MRSFKTNNVKNYWSVLLVFFSFSAAAQWGCTDPFAANFDPTAQSNNGSCLYDSTTITLSELALLPSQLAENSGLFIHNDTLWTHNDSGGQPILYAIDTLGQILHQVVVANASNIDWEAVTTASSFGYIGDIGNNSGTRQNLLIYRFSLTDLLADTLYVDTISYTYSNQTSFVANALTNFDAEAFFVVNDTVHLFSKNWGNQFTNHYVFPAQVGHQTAQIIDSFFVDGLITDVAFHPFTKRIVLLGYKEISPSFYASFVWVLSDYNASFFSGNKRKIGIGNMLQVGQTEGITFLNHEELMVTAEQIQAGFLSIPPRLFRLNLSSVFQETGDIPQNSIKINVFPNPTSHLIRVENLPKSTSYQLIDANGKLLAQGELAAEHAVIFLDKQFVGSCFLQLTNVGIFKIVVE
jgi:hypothetical protein